MEVTVNTYSGDFILPSILSEATIREKLSRLGGTLYEAREITVTIDEGLMVPISRLNALRREVLALLSEKKREARSSPAAYRPVAPGGTRPAKPTAGFEYADAIPASAEDYFEHIYLPLDRYLPVADGVVLPAVIFDHEREKVKEMLENAVGRGAKHALVGNVGHLSLVREAGLCPHGDFRLNVTNSEALAFLLSLGFTDVLLSPELSLPQIRDLKGAADAIVYGRIPLMTLEKCVGKELGGCELCERGKTVLVDRRGEKFPVLRQYPHRSIVVNSRPTCMSDKQRELAAAGIVGGHYIFTTETAAEAARVIEAYQNGRALTVPVRRI